MYKESAFPSRILIVKTSSLGDIIQSFSVLDDLKRRFPNVMIDWAVEAVFSQIVAAHPLVRKPISLDIKGRKNLFSALKQLRREKYDLVFDLQGNCKSGLITLLSRGKVKVGYALQSVREWPNILATNVRFNISKDQNIRSFYLELVEKYFCSPALETEGVRFHISDEERKLVSKIISQLCTGVKVMVCPHSKWSNKQLKINTLIALLQKIEREYEASFLLIWGERNEKDLCERLAANVAKASIVDRLSIPVWQNLMSEVDLVMAVDSSALHLCATTKTPSFSIFGPTTLEIFKPIGQRHFAVQGSCPYGETFVKQCPFLRSCATGACMKDLKAEELFEDLLKSKLLRKKRDKDYREDKSILLKWS